MTEPTPVADVLSEATRVVLNLCAEFNCTPGGDWQRLAERAYMEGRIAGLEWAHQTVKR